MLHIITWSPWLTIEIGIVIFLNNILRQMRHFYFGGAHTTTMWWMWRHKCTHNAETMFDIIKIGITNINLKCTKVFSSFITYHNKLLSYFNKIILISYAFVYMKDQTIVNYWQFHQHHKINLYSFCGLSLGAEPTF